MELRCRESSSGRIGCKVGRLVISGRVERTTMVTTLEGRALSRPKHKRKGTLEGGRSSFKVWDDTAVVPQFLKKGLNSYRDRKTSMLSRNPTANRQLIQPFN